MAKKSRKGVNRNGQERAEINLLDHLEKIVALTGKRGFTDSFFEKAEPHIKYAAGMCMRNAAVTICPPAGSPGMLLWP